jgi:hypothetical protein
MKTYSIERDRGLMRAMAAIGMAFSIATSFCENSYADEAVASPAPVKVAVVDFSSARGGAFTSCNVTMTPLKDAGRDISSELSQRLATWSSYQILDRDEVQKAVQKCKLYKRGFFDRKALEKLAELTGADAVIVGQTEGNAWSGKGHAGASLYASAQMLSTYTGEVVWSIDGSVTDTQTSKNIVSELAGDMTERLYVKLQELEATRPLVAYREAK